MSAIEIKNAEIYTAIKSTMAEMRYIIPATNDRVAMCVLANGKSKLNTAINN